MHGPGAVTGADANRLLGLQIMGIDMALLAHEQLRDDYRFEQVRKMVAAKLGVTYREKTVRQKRHERDLVDELFCNWGALGRRGG